MTSEGTGELNAALAAARAEFPSIERNRSVSTRSYSFAWASLDMLYDTLLPIMARHGLSWSAVPRGENMFGTLRHESGQIVEGWLPLGQWTQQQDLGKAITYASRYLFSSMVGVAPETDTDGVRDRDTNEPVDSYSKPLGGKSYININTSGVATPQANNRWIRAEELPETTEAALVGIEPLSKPIGRATLQAVFDVGGRKASALLFPGDPLSYIAQAFCVPLGEGEIWARKVVTAGKPIDISATPFYMELVRRDDERSGKSYININTRREDRFTLNQPLIQVRLAQKYGVSGGSDWQAAIGVSDPGAFDGSLEQAESLLQAWQMEVA